jgi:hypothetical protein
MKTLCALLVLLWLATLPTAAAATDALNDALQRGLLAEEARRDLPAAVAAYAEAVRAGDDLRAPMATALFRLAESQRRLGQTNEALGHYRRLLREFPEQTNLVALARRQVPKAAIRSRGVALIEAELAERTKALEALESSEAELAAELERCSAMGADQLHAALSASHPTPELTRLRAERNQAEVRRAMLNPDFGPQHPEVLRIAAVQAKLDDQLAKEVEGVMGSLAAQESALKARVAQERRNVKALEKQILQESLSSDGRSGSTSVERRSVQEQLLLEELKDGDRVDVPARSIVFSQDTGGTVSIVGQVSRPGRVELPAGKSLDLIEAIAASGGLTRAADRKRIKMRRDNAVQNLDWDDAMKNRFELRPGDVVEVGERTF